MKEFKLLVVTPDGVKFDGMAQSVLVSCASGDVEIMAGHTDYFASLATGRTRIIADGKTMLASSSGGFLSVEKGEVHIAAITLEFSDEIDLKRAEIAKANAEEKIKDAKDDAALDKARASLERALNRIKIASI